MSALFWGAAASPLACAETSSDGEWIGPVHAGDPLVWGRRDGLVFGLPSPGGLRGPRGLIRVGVVSPRTGRPELLNFIAVEPVVAGPGSRFSRMAFSELESSQMDAGSTGKRLWVGGERAPEDNGGSLRVTGSAAHAIEILTVRIEVERFQANRAHVYLLASIASDHPNELALAVERYDDSPALDELSLTATMGNYERLRRLWLKDRIVDSRRLYASYSGDDFAEQGNYPLKDMLRTGEGDAIVLSTTNETDPSAHSNPRAAEHWQYRLPSITQYWRVPGRSVEPNLRVRVNGRRVYWASHDTVPGGIAFENFEVRERFVPGQVFIFGVSEKQPWEFDPPIPHLPPLKGSAAPN